MQAEVAPLPVPTVEPLPMVPAAEVVASRSRFANLARSVFAYGLLGFGALFPFALVLWLKLFHQG